MTGRDRTVAAVLAVVACVAAYWFLLLAPKRDEAARLQDQLSRQKRALTTALAQAATALQAKRDYASNYATVARLGQAVPADDSVPSLVFQLDSAAKAAGVDFRGVKLEPAGTASAAPETPSGTSGDSSSSSGHSSSSTTTPPADASATAAAGLPPGASVGPAGFPTMPFTLTFRGSFFHMADFLRRVDRFVRAGGRTVRVGGRLLTVDGLSLKPADSGFPAMDATLAANAYLIPPGPDTTAGASPAAPAGGGSTTSTTSPTSPSAPASAAVTSTP